MLDQVILCNLSKKGEYTVRRHNYAYKDLEYLCVLNRQESGWIRLRVMKEELRTLLFTHSEGVQLEGAKRRVLGHSLLRSSSRWLLDKHGIGAYGYCTQLRTDKSAWDTIKIYTSVTNQCLTKGHAYMGSVSRIYKSLLFL